MSDLYEQDFIAWTAQQALLLRQAAASSNLGLDWANLIEEVESLGRSELRALESQVERLILHLLKLEFSPALAPRAGWVESVDDARSEIRRHLRFDPGLKPRLPGAIADAQPEAVRKAANALRTHGEDPSGILARARAGAIYAQDALFGDWLPEPPAPP